VTVLIGNNGAGKTSILKALATSLSWFVSRVRSEKSTGNPILEHQILNGTNSASLTITVRDQDEYGWAIAKSRSGRKGDHVSSLHEVTLLSENYRNRLTENESTSLPVIAFYPVERSILDISLKRRQKHSSQQLDGYDNSLNQGVDFRRFFEWFREREDIENEVYAPSALQDIEKLSSLLENSEERLEKIEQFNFDALAVEMKKVEEAIRLLRRIQPQEKEGQLSAVRSALESFMPGFRNLKVRRKPRLHMTIEKNNETLDVAQLSQGEKSLMALVGDIARRLSMMNPQFSNPLLGSGVIIIDEIDMHLHPQWARTLIERLTSTFPNCQFILSTHSPLVISDYKDALIYSLENGVLNALPSLYGEDVNTVLLGAMDTNIRNATVAKKFNDLFDLIQNKELALANELLMELEGEIPVYNLELSKAKLMLRKEELRLEKN
jgi:predicted ATP-binding protein involved in virulence